MEETERTAARMPEQPAPEEAVQSPSAEENYYGNTARMRGDGPAPAKRDTYGTTGSIHTQHPAGSYGTTGSIPTQRPAGSYGTTGSIRTQRPATTAGTTGRIPTQRPAGSYGTTGTVRTQHPAGGYGTTGSIHRPVKNPDEPDPNETGSLKINHRRAAEPLPDEPLFENAEDAGEEQLSGLAALLASIPPKKLAAGGVIIASILIAVILLVVLIPRGPKTTVVAETPTPVATETPVSAPVLNTPEPLPAVTQHPVANPITKGMKDPIVAEIQQRLIDLGYMDYPVVDGVETVTTSYGNTTYRAVKVFQEFNGLDNDGWCGQGTYDLLMSDQAKPLTIKHGVKSAMVTKLQKRLKALGFYNAKIGDTCGPDTITAIKAFQTANNLQADGQAGPQTLELMYSDNALDKNGRATPMVRESTEEAESAQVTEASGAEVPVDNGELIPMDDDEIVFDPEAEG